MSRKAPKAAAKPGPKPRQTSRERDAQEVVAWLKRKATRKTREGMARYGIPSDGPQGVFGMDVGYKAAIASFAQEASGWYPDRQAEWLFKPPKRSKAGGLFDAKELGRIDSTHHKFAGCQSVLIERAKQTIQLSASDVPLPFQQDPTPGVISGRFRWSGYNEVFAKQTAPPGALTLAALLARR